MLKSQPPITFLHRWLRKPVPPLWPPLWLRLWIEVLLSPLLSTTSDITFVSYANCFVLHVSFGSSLWFFLFFFFHLVTSRGRSACGTVCVASSRPVGNREAWRKSSTETPHSRIHVLNITAQCKAFSASDAAEHRAEVFNYPRKSFRVKKLTAFG